MNICVISDQVGKNTSGVLFHRLLTPHEFLEKLGLAKVYVSTHFSSLPQEVKNAADIVVFSKVPPFYTTPILEIEEMKNRGAKVVVDIDDVWYDHEGHILKNVFRGPLAWQYPHPRDEAILKVFNLADLITTPSKFLERKIKEITQTTILYTPNLVDVEREQYKVNKKTAEGVFRIGYMGNAMHLHDFKVCAPALSSVISRGGANIEFWYAGFSKESGDEQLNIIQSHLPKGAKFVGVPYRDYNSYADFYNYVDVAIAPLRDIEFNWGKSILKICEASLMKTPIIASKIPPYSTECWYYPYLCSSKQEWEYALGRFWGDKQYTRMFGELMEADFSSYKMNRETLLPRINAYKKLLGG